MSSPKLLLLFVLFVAVTATVAVPALLTEDDAIRPLSSEVRDELARPLHELWERHIPPRDTPLALLSPGTLTAIRDSAPLPAVALPPAQEAATSPVPVPGTQRDPADSGWSRHEFASGDVLSSLWSRHWGLSTATLYHILEDTDSSAILNRIFPGQTMEWQTDSEGQLTHLRLWRDERNGHEWVWLDEQGFALQALEAERHHLHRVLAVAVTADLTQAVREVSSLSRAQANALLDELEQQAGVRSTARPGDHLRLVLRKTFIVGETQQPVAVQLLAFYFKGQKNEVVAIRHHRHGYFYTPEGQGLQAPFDRKPFRGEYRLSSGFSPQRRHPVTGRVAPHLGTDFVMPIGTPIHAPADGLVVLVDHGHPTAGRYIEIDHADGLHTRYMHLSRIRVSTGQTVQRGDIIGLSGNSGRVTAPHLHYELHVNGRAVDAMRASLPQSEALTGTDLATFRAAAQPMLTALASAQGSDERISTRLLAFLQRSGRD